MSGGDTGKIGGLRSGVESLFHLRDPISVVSSDARLGCGLCGIASGTRIDISAYDFTGFADLTIQTSGGESIIDLDKSAADINEITVIGVTSLGTGDFIFT